MRIAGFLTVAAATMLTLADASNAAIVHRYEFSGNANDTVGTANGTLLANGTIDADQLVTLQSTAGTATGVSLPVAAVTGLTGNFSIEQYATYTNPANNTNFTALFAFGNNNTQYLLASPRRGTAGNPSGVAYNPIGGGAGAFSNETVLAGPTFGAGTTTFHFVTTYDSAAQIARLYINGALTATSAALATPFNLELVGQTFRGINGSSPFDPGFNGSTDDFRIYDQTLTATQVTALNVLGADSTTLGIQLAIGEVAVPEPMSIGLLGAGAMGLLARRRRNA